MLTVHHLNESRSHRILWLLEELGLPYEIKYYQRDPHTRAAPVELKNIHPLGKSPVVSGDDGAVVAESGAIIDYIIRRYGEGRLQPIPASPEYDDYVYWLHYAEGSAILPFIMKSTVNGLSFVLRRGHSSAGPLERHVEEEIGNHMSYIDASLGERTYLLGDALTAADIQLSFVGEQASKATDMTRYPNVEAWLQRLKERPAYQSALARGELADAAAPGAQK